MVWLWDNEEVMGMVKRGIKQAKRHEFAESPPDLDVDDLLVDELDQHLRTMHNLHWNSEDATTWWTCGKCDYRLPVATVKELIAYLNDGCPKEKESKFDLITLFGLSSFVVVAILILFAIVRRY